MSRPLTANEPLYDAFLREVSERSGFTERALGLLGDELPPPGLPPGLRERLVAGLSNRGRLERFAGQVAGLLDIDQACAAQLLDEALTAQFLEPVPGIGVHAVVGGPSVNNALRAFVRVRAGEQFPLHEHLGVERLLVLQGALRDPSRGVVFGPGDLDELPAGSTHTFWVASDGPDLLGLSVTEVGLRVFGQTLLANRS